MQVGELFAGIGGFGLALERAGMRVSWQAEIDTQARRVLERHWPEVERHRDVREVGFGNLRAVDVVVGGFPCQDVSVAGRRAGLGGERSGLWWQFYRVLAELKPRWCVIENVPGLLSAVCPDPDTGKPVSGGSCPGGCMRAHGGAMGTVLGALGSLGYGFAYRVLDAQRFGLAQRRARVWIVGCLGDAARAAKILLEPEGLRGHLAPSSSPRPDVAGTLGSQPEGSGWRDDPDRAGAFIVSSANSNERESHARETSVARALDSHGAFAAGQGGTLVADALTARHGRTRVGAPLTTTPYADTAASESRLVVAFDPEQITCPDNRSNPQPGDPCHTLHKRAPAIAHALTDGGNGRMDASVETLIADPITPRESRSYSHAGNNPRPRNVVVAFQERGREGGRNVETQADLAYALTAPKGGGRSQEKCISIAYAPTAAVPVGLRSDASREGRALTPSADAEGRTRLRDPGFNVLEDLAPTLEASGPHSVGVPNVGVRRLTPRECERLQGFPDDWTAGQKDAPRYAQLGNAVPVDVVEWIGRRIMAEA